MSRSFKRSPFIGTTNSTTEKQEKRTANRHLRRAVRRKIGETSDAMELPLLREVSNVWSMSKDGKVRFRVAEAPWLMRK